MSKNQTENVSSTDDKSGTAGGNEPPNDPGTKIVLIFAAFAVPLEGLQQTFPTVFTVLPLTGASLGQLGFLVGIGYLCALFTDLFRK